MRDPLPVSEAPSGAIDGTNTTYCLTYPYFPTSVRVFINLVEQTLDSFQEISPTLGKIKLNTPPILGDELVVTYLDSSFNSQPSQAKSKHISEIRQGDILRLTLKAGKHLNPLILKGKAYLVPPNKPRMASGFSRTVFLCYVNSNDYQNGQMTVQVQDWINRNLDYEAIISYNSILTVQVYLAGYLNLHETADSIHPGSKGLGSLSFGVFQSSSALLVPVKF